MVVKRLDVYAEPCDVLILAHQTKIATQVFVAVLLMALRHQQYRYEDLRRDLGLMGQDQNIAWLRVNIQPFDYHLNFACSTTILNKLSQSPTDALSGSAYDHG